MKRSINSDKSSSTRPLLDDCEDENPTDERQSLIEYTNNDGERIQQDNRVRFRQLSSKVSSLTVNANLSDEGIELRENLATKDPLDVIYYPVQPDDTLGSVCLRYACSINQVKRLNGLINDQDFYGLSRLKLPVGKLGLLKDLLNKKDIPPVGQSDERTGNQTRPRSINCPGSALSLNDDYRSNFRPIQNPVLSSDRIYHSHTSVEASTELQLVDSRNSVNPAIPHSQSFSSIREYGASGINIDVLKSDAPRKPVLAQRNFIKPDLDDKIDIDDLIMNGRETMGKVFQDLDFHVEKVKMSAKGYDQRAADLVDQLDAGNFSADLSREAHPQGPRVPHTFFCNENFGFNYKRLLAFIFLVCVVVPIVYINQLSVVKQA